MRLSWILAAGLALTGAAPVFAEDIFSDDFQDGEADGWGRGGEGDVRLTQYEDNISIRLSETAASFLALTTEGYQDVRISAAMAASGLSRGEACVFEATFDDGANWVDVVRIEDGQDDAVTLHPGAISDDRFDNKARIILRARAAGDADTDQCWLDNVRVTGQWFAEASAAEAFELSPAFLTGTDGLASPVSTMQYAVPEDALPASGDLTGLVSLSPGPSNIDVFQDLFGIEALPGTELARLPSITVAFVQSEGRLLPASRGLIETGHPYWDVILTPGRVWREAGDGEWNRAALPFALVEKNANCTHNGLLTFLFDADGRTSRAAWQIGSETCAYFQFNAWGMANVALQSEPVANADAVILRDIEERSARLPVRAMSALTARYPGIDPDAFRAAQVIDPEAMTVFGLVADGIHYAGGCETRFGPYPYCDALVLPSFSLAKSLFGGLGLMRLDQHYPGARDALITDYVPECAAAGGWEGVTFEHALDMSTGRYDETGYEADEAASAAAGFFDTATHGEKTEMACGLFERRSSPGQQWSYHTTDTYLLGVAMQAFLEERTGVQADVYRDLVRDPLWHRLGLSETLDETRRTTGEPRQAFTGWGLFMQRGDLARLLQFLGPDYGSVDGVNLIDPEQLDGAVGRDTSDRGLPAPQAPFAYNDGFWSWDIREFGGCNAATPIPFMSGYGGIAAVLIPNGTAYYYVSDGYQFSWARAALATEAIAPFCTGLN